MRRWSEAGLFVKVEGRGKRKSDILYMFGERHVAHCIVWHSFDIFMNRWNYGISN